jgi:hypothetical protein
MGNNLKDSDSFLCYNCKEKNFFDKSDYIRNELTETGNNLKSGTSKVKEVSIECKSCREINNVRIEY